MLNRHERNTALARTVMQLAVLLTVLLASPVAARDGKLKVVASFSILADLAANIGGDHIQLSVLVPAGADPHVYQPSPADAANLAKADLVFLNGLKFEGFLERLITASASQAVIVAVSKGASLLNHQNGNSARNGQGVMPPDPHAWQNVANALIYVDNISKALCAADRGNCDDYRSNAARYADLLNALDRSIRLGFAGISRGRRVIITAHAAFAHFGRAYGLDMLAPVGAMTGAVASARSVAGLIRQIRRQNVTALFTEAGSDPRLMKQIADETGVTIGGELYADTLSPNDGRAASYIAMMRHNSKVILSALKEP